MTFGEKIKQLRIDKGLTQEQASEKIGIAISSLRNYENIEKPRLPDTYQLKQIRDFYNVPYEYLLDDNSNNKNYENLGIGNKLNLSDKTIEKIVEINTKVSSELIGKFIDCMSINKFWNKINEYMILSKEIKELSPALEIIKYKELFEKYAVKDSLENYFDIDDGQDVRESYRKANACHYLPAEKKQLLECLKILENNKVLHNFDGLDDEDIEIKIHTGCYNEINEINLCITSDTKFSLNDAKLCLTYPQKEIDKRKKDMEILGFYISKEFNTFLSYLDNEEAE